jgi:hypothetical protein
MQINLTMSQKEVERLKTLTRIKSGELTISNASESLRDLPPIYVPTGIIVNSMLCTAPHFGSKLNEIKFMIKVKLLISYVVRSYL